MRKALNARSKANPKVIEEQTTGAKAAGIHHFIGESQAMPISLLSFANMSRADESLESGDGDGHRDLLAKVRS
jgi:hypothetical protein